MIKTLTLSGNTSDLPGRYILNAGDPGSGNNSVAIAAVLTSPNLNDTLPVCGIEDACDVPSDPDALAALYGDGNASTGSFDTPFPYLLVDVPAGWAGSITFTVAR